MNHEPPKASPRTHRIHEPRGSQASTNERSSQQGLHRSATAVDAARPTSAGHACRTHQSQGHGDFIAPVATHTSPSYTRPGQPRLATGPYQPPHEFIVYTNSNDHTAAAALIINTARPPTGQQSGALVYTNLPRHGRTTPAPPRQSQSHRIHEHSTDHGARPVSPPPLPVVCTHRPRPHLPRGRAPS